MTDAEAIAIWNQLPSQYRHALKSARYLGGSISCLMPDRFISGTSSAELDDLVELGLMRKRWRGWEVTLNAWKVLADHRLVG